MHKFLSSELYLTFTVSVASLTHFFTSEGISNLIFISLKTKFLTLALIEYIC